MAGIAVVGCVAAFVLAGPRGLIGFGAGTVFSMLTALFFWRVAERVGSAEPAPKPFRGAVIWLGLRYFLFGLAGYAIVNYFGASLAALIAGCFVAVAAVILEILYELIYART